jgi:Ca2+-binding RTX toxin-like protein
VRLPVRTVFGTPGPRIVAALIGLAQVGLPSPVAGAVTCSLSGATLFVSLSAPEDAASVVRVGSEIEVRAESIEVSCGGAPTVDTVDSVNVTDTSIGTTTFTIDLSGGAFEPGVTTGGEGTSPEIEFHVDLGAQFPDRLTVVGSGGDDDLSFSGAGINLNGLEPPTVDPDVTASGVEDFEVRGGPGADTVTGTPLIGQPFGAKMILRGEEGVDDLTGGAGPDELFGGDGADVLDGASGADGVSGDSDDDIIEGGSGADDLFGGGGTDALEGQAGQDRLDGGDGVDAEDGGADNDVFDQGPASNGGDTLHGGTGFDLGAYDLRQASLAIAVGVPGSDGEAGEGDVVEGDVEAVLGGAGDDTLTGADVVDNVLRGGPGADVIDGGTGDDTVDGDAGGDVLSGGGGQDTVSFFGAPAVIVNLASGTATGEGNDTLSGFFHAEGGAHGDALIGSASANLLTGRGGNDTLAGEAGNDQLRGNGGADTVSYAASVISVSVNLASGTAVGQGSDGLVGIENATGGAAADSLVGNLQPNALVGGGGNDSIVGADGADDLRGQAGQDAVQGENGSDTIAGGDGNDTLAGSGGADVFLEGEQRAANGADGIAGGMGRDLVTYAGRRNGVRVSVGAAKGDGQKGEGDSVGRDAENVRGTKGRDVLVGNGKKNTLIGAAGNDLLQGRGGTDRLLGGAGDDRLDGGPSTDVCRGGGGRNVLKDCGKRRGRPG